MGDKENPVSLWGLVYIWGLSRGIQPCNMENRDIYWRRYGIQETLYIGQCTSHPFKVVTLGLHTVLLVAISCPIIISWISFMVWNLFPFKGDFSFGISQKSQGTKFGVYGGWVTWVIWCFTKKLHEMWCMSGHVVFMKLPITSCP